MDNRWMQSFGEFKEFVSKNGRLPRSVGFEDEKRLYSWFNSQRRAAREGTLSPERVKHLGALFSDSSWFSSKDLSCSVRLASACIDSRRGDFTIRELYDGGVLSFSRFWDLYSTGILYLRELLVSRGYSEYYRRSDVYCFLIKKLELPSDWLCVLFSWISGIDVVEAFMRKDYPYIYSLRKFTENFTSAVYLLDRSVVDEMITEAKRCASRKMYNKTCSRFEKYLKQIRGRGTHFYYKIRDGVWSRGIDNVELDSSTVLEYGVSRVFVEKLDAVGIRTVGELQDYLGSLSSEEAYAKLSQIRGIGDSGALQILSAYRRMG